MFRGIWLSIQVDLFLSNCLWIFYKIQLKISCSIIEHTKVMKLCILKLTMSKSRLIRVSGFLLTRNLIFICWTKGIYRLTCNDCNTAYIKKPVRKLKTRISQFLKYFEKSTFIQYINFNIMIIHSFCDF